MGMQRRSVGLVSCEAESFLFPQNQKEVWAGARQCLRIAGRKARGFLTRLRPCLGSLVEARYSPRAWNRV